MYGTPLKHPIDGDGYIVRLSFVNGKVHLKSKYVDTFSHVKEREARKMIFPGQMGSTPPELTTARFRDPSHTNSFYWGGKVVSCHEYVLPNTLDPTTLETLGSDDLAGAIDGIKALSAHFRYDAVRDCLITVSFRPGNVKRSSSVRFCEFDRQWRYRFALFFPLCEHPICAIYDDTRLLHTLDLHLPDLNYVHDFVATPTHYVVHVTPFVNVRPEVTAKILRGELSLGESMRYYPELPSKMIVVERFPTGAAAATVEFETEPCHIYHFGTCTQQSADRITFDAVCLPPGARPVPVSRPCPPALRCEARLRRVPARACTVYPQCERPTVPAPGFTMEWEHRVFLSNMTEAPGTLHRYTADLTKRSLTREVLDYAMAEFPTTNPYRHIGGSGGSVPARYVCASP